MPRGSMSRVWMVASLVRLRPKGMVGVVPTRYFTGREANRHGDR